MTASSALDVLEDIISSEVDAAAAEADAAGAFPRAAVAALGERGSRSQFRLGRS